MQWPKSSNFSTNADFRYSNALLALGTRLPGSLLKQAKKREEKHTHIPDSGLRLQLHLDERWGPKSSFAFLH